MMLGPVRSRVLVLLGVCVAAIPTGAQSQTDASKTQVLMGVSLNILQTDHPEGAGFAAGALLGLERSLTPAASVRAVTTVLRGIYLSGDTALCRPTPEGCLPDGIFPRWVFRVSVEGSVAPNSKWPLRIVAGLGAQLAADAAEKHGRRPPDLGSRLDPVVRLGIDLRLGSSPRAAVLQVSRTGFTGSQYSVSAIDAVSLTGRR
jgi:hypothetical protein